MGSDCSSSLSLHTCFTHLLVLSVSAHSSFNEMACVSRSHPPSLITVFTVPNRL